MTKQEVEALRTKLTRIWEPESVEHWHQIKDIFRWDFALQKLSGVHIQRTGVFWIQITDKADTVGLLWREDKQTNELHRFYIQDDRKILEDTHEVRAFVAQYLPQFRRNCWLSGANIEASAYDKAEWLQGLTCEEIELWNLKI